MNEELLSILRAARRKLVATRAMEAAAAMTTVGAIFAAAGQTALLIGAWHPHVGFVLSRLLILAFVVVCWSVLERRRRLVGKRTLAHIFSLFTGFLVGIAVMGVNVPLWQGLPRMLVPAIGVLLLAAVGAGLTLTRGAALRDVAAMLDAKAGLRERLSTAAELAISAQPLPPSAPVVFAQALAALKEKRPQHLPMWTATPSLPAGMGLALAACLALAFLPDFGSGRQGTRIEQFSQAVPALTAEQRQRLAEAFRSAAAQQAFAPAVSRELVKAAAIVEVKDAQELQQVLQKLQEAGFAPLAAVPPDLLAAAGLPTPATRTAGNNGGHQGGDSASREANEPGAGGGYVSVYDPRYAAPSGGGASDANRSPSSPPADVPYADAWAAARARAADHAQRGDVPPAYRRLVHDFFAGP
jgi:hypothetical protein